MDDNILISGFKDALLSTVHHRFLCGSSALRESRQVSRMRLYHAMVEQDGTDLGASLLVSDIRRYESAKNFLLNKKRITVKDLLKAHRKLLGDTKNSGELRTVDGWVGKSRELATYVAPAPKNVSRLLSDFLTSINNHQRFNIEDIVRLYSQFLTIHPFCDGNGRMSRVLVEYMQQRADVKTHFSLFRLGMNIEEYQNAVLAFGVRSDQGIKAPYWQKMIAWIAEYEANANQLVKELQSLLQTKVALSPLNALDLKIIAMLLKQPITSLNAVCQAFKVDAISCKQSLTRLVTTDIIKPYKTKVTKSGEVLVCHDICQFTMKLDEQLFDGKELA